jgi:hypothetical protein
MNNSEVAHAWANQTKQSGTGSNFYFNGPEIYSYGSHFLAGEVLAPGFYWINDQRYSSSTNKHQSHIRHALYFSDRKIYHFRIFHSHSDYDTVKYDFEEAKERFKSARHPWKYYDTIFRTYLRYRDFNTFVNKKKGKYFRFYSYITKGSAKERKNLLNRMKYFIDKHYDKVAAWDEKRAEISAKKEARRQREREIRQLRDEQKLELWLNNEYSLPLYSLQKAYLRISKDGKKVQTSKGASVRVESAKILYKMIKAGKEIRGHNIDGFTVKSINGTLEIGCHSIDMDSVKKVGELILNK